VDRRPIVVLRRGFPHGDERSLPIAAAEQRPRAPWHLGVAPFNTEHPERAPGGRVMIGASFMSFTSRSVAIVFLITFGLFSLAGFGVVVGAPLLLLVAAALAAPAFVLRDSADVMPTSHDGAPPSADVNAEIREPAQAAA